MVSLISLYTYLSQLPNATDLDLFREFLGQRDLTHRDFEETVTTRLIGCLYLDDKTQAEKLVCEYSERNPDADSQYIYKDLLVFLFICVTNRYQLNREWLQRILTLRRNVDEEKTRLTATFKNLINDNFSSTENFVGLVLVYKELQGIRETDRNVMDELIASLSMKPFPLHSSEFLNVITVRATELVIIYKGLAEQHELEEHRSFVTVFKGRIAFLSRILIWLPFVVVACLLSYYSWVLLRGTAEQSSSAEKMLIVLAVPFFVLPFLGWASGKKGVEFVSRHLEKLFGYNDQTPS